MLNQKKGRYLIISVHHFLSSLLIHILLQKIKVKDKGYNRPVHKKVKKKMRYSRLSTFVHPSQLSFCNGLGGFPR
jgi:hypothetical protein